MFDYSDHVRSCHRLRREWVGRWVCVIECLGKFYFVADTYPQGCKMDSRILATCECANCLPLSKDVYAYRYSMELCLEFTKIICKSWITCF